MYNPRMTQTKSAIENIRRQIMKDHNDRMLKLSREYHRVNSDTKKKLKALDVLDGSSRKQRKTARHAKTKPNKAMQKVANANPEKTKSLINQIREFISAQTGNFGSGEALKYLKEKGENPAQSTVSTTLIRLYKDYGEIIEIGRNGRAAVYKKK
jgi:hypothetical protein